MNLDVHRRTLDSSDKNCMIWPYSATLLLHKQMTMGHIASMYARLVGDKILRGIKPYHRWGPFVHPCRRLSHWLNVPIVPITRFWIQPLASDPQLPLLSNEQSRGESERLANTPIGEELQFYVKVQRTMLLLHTLFSSYRSSDSLDPNQVFTIKDLRIIIVCYVGDLWKPLIPTMIGEVGSYNNLF